MNNRRERNDGQRSEISFGLHSAGYFFGYLGIHNFYAGYTKTAIIQLVLSLVTLGIGAFISSIWAIVEAITVTQDANGRRMM